MGARRWVSALRLHGRRQYPDCDRFRVAAHRDLCDPGPAGDVAGRPAVGARRLCGVYRGAPLAPESHSEVPAALSHRFVVVVTLTSLLFWGLLGVSTSIAFGRISRPLDRDSA